MEKMLESGARLVVSDARFQDADALFKALAKNVRHMTLTPDLLKMDVAVLQGPIIDAATSDEVSDKLFKCLALCTYEGQRVSRNSSTTRSWVGRPGRTTSRSRGR